MSRFPCRLLVLALWMLALVAGPDAWAIRPARFVQSTESEFEPGVTDNTVVTNLGDVALASSVQVLAQPDDGVSVIYDLQDVGDVTYLAAGPEGKLLGRVGDQVTEVIAAPDEQIFCLARYQGKLMLGLSGKISRVAMLNDQGQLETVVELPDARYIWDIVFVDDGSASPPIYVATGIAGTLYRVAVDEQGNPQAQVILQAHQANLLSLAMPDADRLYVGTDTDGLIYRLTRQADGSFEPFVLYDAPEPEIATLLALGDGTLYAGTADAQQARPGRLGELVEEEVGRVSPDAGSAESDETPPAPPSPDDLPDVPPGPQETTAPAGPAMAVHDGEAVKGEPALAEDASAESAQDDPQMSEPTAEDATAAADAAPTAQQHDRLRALVRKRLAKARKSGALSPGSGRSTGSADSGDSQGSRSSARAVRTTSEAETGPKEGNAIYRIDDQGFVSEVFRESVMILNLADDQGKLIVATGNEGQIFRVDPTRHETTIIADLEPEQVPALRVSPQGVLLGSANPAQLILLTGQTAATGTYDSPIMDAAQISLWGAMRLTAYIPQSARVAVQTRSGNVEDPQQAPWSAWSDSAVLDHDPKSNALQPRQLNVEAPPARFLQYRLTLTGHDDRHPVVGRVETAYVTPNLRPQVASFKAAYPEVSPPQPGQEEMPVSPTLTAEWEASDPNGDALLFDLAYQPAGGSTWVTLVSDLDALSYEWDTRRAPDGWYLLRVTATDKLDNPPDMAMATTRRSAPVLLDTSTPTLEAVRSDVQQAAVILSGIAVDAWSPIQSVAYAVDDQELFEPILPTDLIFDSTREAWSITIADLSPGSHVITLRVTDVRGNVGYQARIVNLAP